MRRYVSAVLLILCLVVLSYFPFRLHQYSNNGESSSKGSLSSGNLNNAYLFPYAGTNWKYFSPLSYYYLQNGFAHSRMHKCILGAYAKCELSCPNVSFRLMETANKKGGKMLVHKTHQTGLSADFMTPLIKGDKPFTSLDNIGLLRYLVNFDNEGNLLGAKDIQIDFETMAKHILDLDDSAKENKLKIAKVILKIELKDELFASQSGKLLQKRGIYFAQSLPPIVNSAHDDHYHIDFEIL